MSRLAPPQSALRSDSSPARGERARLKHLARRLRKEMTVHESLLWQDLKLLAEFRFRRQVVIGPYIVDFACFKTRIIIELDGSQHNLAKHMDKDKQRDNWLSSQNFRVLRFWNFDSGLERDGIIDTLYQELTALPLDGGAPRSGEGVNKCHTATREIPRGECRARAARET